MIELKTMPETDRLILARIAPAATLGETVREVRRRVATARPTPIKNSEILVIPVLQVDVLKKYDTLCRRKIRAANEAVDGSKVALAEQTIRFKLDETGASLKSEAIAAASKMPRRFIFNKPFLVLLQARGAENPYFALWVGNAELLIAQ